MDFNTIHFSLPVVFSIFIAVAVIFFIFFFERKSNFYPDYRNAIPVVEVIRALEKICPINSSNKWKLFPFQHGCHRCWSYTLTLPFLKNNLNLYGCATAVNSSSVSICSLIVDVTKLPEWNPFCTSQYIGKSFSDKQLRRDHYMEAEQVICIIRETNKIHTHIFMYRFHDFSENKVGWILFWNPKKLEFLYFLIQPVKNKNESPLCVVTHIMGTESKLSSFSISLVSQRLRNIQDLATVSALCIVPSTFMSSVHPKLEDSALENKYQTTNGNNQENCFSLSSIRARKREVRNTIFILVPFVSYIHVVWKRDVEFKLAIRNMNSASDKKSHLHGLKDHASDSKDEFLPKLPLRRACSDVGFNSKALTDQKKNSNTSDISKDISVSNNKVNFLLKKSSVKDLEQNSNVSSEDSETKNHAVRKAKIIPQSKLRSYSEAAINKLQDYEFSCTLIKAEDDCERVYKLQNINENVEEKLLAIDEQNNKEIFNSSISDYEVIENLEYTENKIAAFMTQGNYGAAELQAEVLFASQFEQDMNCGKFQSIGGWMFHSYHKGLCVLTKTTCAKFLRICSFLCQTEISAAPKDIWRFVKNPQFRFICDESVKSVEVLEKISNSQRIIRTYHEVSGLIRKELIDFCLLQTEREELNKYYSCFYSVESDKCPFMKAVIRGILRPSGWIVEKVDEVANRSIVTYMMQVLISNPDSMFIQELSTMVPQSVLNLKNYITSKPM